MEGTWRGGPGMRDAKEKQGRQEAVQGGPPYVRGGDDEPQQLQDQAVLLHL